MIDVNRQKILTFKCWNQDLVIDSISKYMYSDQFGLQSCDISFFFYWIHMKNNQTGPNYYIVILKKGPFLLSYFIWRILITFCAWDHSIIKYCLVVRQTLTEFSNKTIFVIKKFVCQIINLRIVALLSNMFK